MQKDSFLWGLKTGVKGTTTEWPNAALEANVTEWSGFSSMFAGFQHEYSKLSSAITFNRWRSYLSFFTSGWNNSGWAEAATLRLYIIDSKGSIEHDAQPIVADDFSICIKTISGIYNRNKVFESSGDNDNPIYGFGDSPTYQGSWGVKPDSQINKDPLNKIAIVGSYQHLVSITTSGNKYPDSSGNYYGFNGGWLEIPIPLEFINTVGESHFKVGALEEFLGTTPTVGDGNQQHNGYIWFHSYEGTYRPQLVITYVSTTYHTSELRNADLTINRNIQEVINRNITYSGIRILDGYPGDDEFFDKSRNISVEHSYSTSDVFELGTRKNVGYRKFVIDICADRRGELDDMTELVYKTLYDKNLDLLDFSYGFINPKPYGSMYCEYMNILDLSSSVDPDRNKYRNIILADFTTTRSGI